MPRISLITVAFLFQITIIHKSAMAEEWQLTIIEEKKKPVTIHLKPGSTHKIPRSSCAAKPFSADTAHIYCKDKDRIHRHLVRCLKGHKLELAIYTTERMQDFIDVNLACKKSI